MSMPEENDAIDMCYVLFCILSLHLGPALWNFVSKKLLNDPKSIVVDSYEFIKTLIDRRTANSTFFTTNKPSDLTQLDIAQKGRLAVAHGYFDEVALNWASYLLSWIELLKMIDAHTTAGTVQQIYDELISGSKTPMDIVLASFTKPNFVNQGLKKESDLTRAQYLKAIRIKLALYKCMVKHLGPALRSEHLRRKGAVRTNSEIDCQNLLFDLLEEWLLQPQHADMTTNVKIIETAKDGRNIVCHANLPLILTDWEATLLSWEKVCRLITNVNTANTIRDVYIDLKSRIDLPLPGTIWRSTAQSKYFANLVRRQVVLNPTWRRPNFKITLTKKPL
ncbi:hypothetical protein DAPPUDRAFT_100743 [Daphnia pulex]|nr:hypothetical protein DAPPUDRAFT_100743 [Daphnia pulex]|eukprot:EFX83383.1 hypothetical protein DAPPUDRAFT_100743 [Daphnia pulex]